MVIPKKDDTFIGGSQNVVHVYEMPRIVKISEIDSDGVASPWQKPLCWDWFTSAICCCSSFNVEVTTITGDRCLNNMNDRLEGCLLKFNSSNSVSFFCLVVQRREVGMYQFVSNLAPMSLT